MNDYFLRRRTIHFWFAGILLSLLLMATPLFSQNVSPVQEPLSADSERYYLDFKRSSLLNVLTILSELTGMNFIAGQEVANRQINMVLDDPDIFIARELTKKYEEGAEGKASDLIVHFTNKKPKGEFVILIKR